jgi:hypothetical protein
VQRIASQELGVLESELEERLQQLHNLLPGGARLQRSLRQAHVGCYFAVPGGCFVEDCCMRRNSLAVDSLLTLL